MRVIVGISGASGAIYGLRLLERLRQRPEAEVHLILTRAGEKTLHLETGKLAADLKQLAHVWHPIENIGSPLASGSFLTDGMVDRSLLDPQHVGDCHGHYGQPAHPGCGRHVEGAPQTDPGDPREPFAHRTPQEPDSALGDGGNHRPARACLLSQASDDSGFGGPQRGPDSGPAGTSGLETRAAGRAPEDLAGRGHSNLWQRNAAKQPPFRETEAPSASKPWSGCSGKARRYSPASALRRFSRTSRRSA